MSMEYDEIYQLQQELTAAQETIKSMLAANGRSLNCAFCGQSYPDGVPESKHHHLLKHIVVCPQHPLPEALTALREIKDCMGGDDPSSGWNSPEDVWGIATKILQKYNIGTPKE